MLRLRTAPPPAPPDRPGDRRFKRHRAALLSWPLLAVLAAVAVLLVLGLAQLLLPAIATRILRHRLAKDGTVLSAQVHAFPAVQLLWQHADRVDLRMADYNVDLSQLDHLLGQAGGVGKLNASVATVRTGLLTLHDATLVKRGPQLIGHADVLSADLQRALPVIDSITPVSSSGGRLTLRGTATVLGLRASVEAVLEASNGKLVVAPSGLLGAFATVTVFSDPSIQVQSVTGREIPGGVSVTVEALER